MKNNEIALKRDFSLQIEVKLFIIHRLLTKIYLQLYWGSDPVPLIYQLQIIQVSIIMQELQELLSEYKVSKGW